MTTTQVKTYTNGHKPSANGSAPDRLPPHSEEAESCVLGSIIIDPTALPEVAAVLQSDMFYLVKNRFIYDALTHLWEHGKPVDFVLLCDRLAQLEQLEGVGGEGYITGLLTAVPTSINARHYAGIVREMSMRRKLIQAASTIANQAYSEANVDTLMNISESAVLGVRGELPQFGVSHPRQYMSEYLERLEDVRQNRKGMLGVPSGFVDMDRLLNGFQPFMYILAARPGMGKSALCLNIADYLTVQKGKRVLMFSVEMSEYQLSNRRIAGLAKIGTETLARPWTLSNDQMHQIREAAGKLSESPLFIDATPRITPAQVRAKAMSLHREYPLDMIIVDHLHYMRPSTSQARKDLEVGESSAELAELAKALNVPVLVAAQLSRSVENRQDKRPMLSDLRESGGIEENAYCVMFLYRDDYYFPDSSERPNVAEIDIAKHRDGPTGKVDLFWNGPLTSFRNLKREDINL